MEDELKYALCDFLKESGHTPRICHTCSHREVTEVGVIKKRIMDYCPVQNTVIDRFASCSVWEERRG